MTKTFEQLIKETPKADVGYVKIHKEDLLNLLKQIRESTIKECIKKAKFKYKRKTITGGGYVTIETTPILNKKSLDLDKNSIELIQ